MWPKIEDFQAWFIATGMAASLPSGAESALRSARKQWEKDTGYSPFVAADGDVSKWFTPADFGDVLEFDGGFVSVTSVEVATTPQGDTIAKTLLTDYVIEREQEDGPYVQLRWIRSPFFGSINWPNGNQPQSVLVTGKRGYCLANSEEAKDAQEAVFQLTAANLDPIVSQADGPLKKVTQGPVTLEYDTQNGLDRAGAFLKFYQSKVREYRRIVI